MHRRNNCCTLDVMQIRQHVNLTIFHLKERLFGPGRFDAVDIRIRSFRSSPPRFSPSRVHVGEHLRMSPNRPLERFHTRALSDPSDSFNPKPWPYDTAFPSALSEIPIHPGLMLSDMPSTGAQLAKAVRPENALSATTQNQLASAPAYVADHLGNLIDVFA